MEAAPDASKRRRRRKRGKKGESIQQTAVGTKAPPVLGASAAGEAQERRPVKRGRPAAAPGGAAVAMAGQSGGTAKRPRQGLSDLQQKFMAKLEGAQFRRLNELLYTRHGDEAFSHFQAAPSDFDVVRARAAVGAGGGGDGCFPERDGGPQYHQGFRAQVSKWPVNPLDVVIEHIRYVDVGVEGRGGGRAELGWTEGVGGVGSRG